MQTNLSYPLANPAPGILDITATLAVAPSVPRNLICTNPSTPDPWSSLRTGLPPLSFLLLADRLAALYAMVFADHPEWLDEEVGHWQREEDIATAVERFLKRMSALFPVHDEIWDVDLEGIEWRLWEIPLIPMGFDEWYDGWDDLKEPSPYLLHMRYSRRDDDASSGRDEFADLYPDHQTPRYLEPHRLVETLRQICAERSRSMALLEPLDALPDLILMLDHNTGNAWLDVGELSLSEGGGYPQWNPGDVAWLTAEWQKAQPVLDRIHRLLDWQNGAPEEIAFKLTAVRDVLLDAYNRVQQAEESATEVTS
ncbi:MAG TPA: hypothetical protein PLD25_30980 [Chloroflexota bacterium]|nr:hypothetical protein [Chloroflexota bacterium]HUM67584.1 hypothetical protein [Chloroflexota bacterium]